MGIYVRTDKTRTRMFADGFIFCRYLEDKYRPTTLEMTSRHSQFMNLPDTRQLGLLQRTDRVMLIPVRIYAIYIKRVVSLAIIVTFIPFNRIHLYLFTFELCF